MAFEHQRAAALRILQSIELGSLSSPELFNLIEEADPTLVYLIFTWLRVRYRSDPAAEGVIGRMVELCKRYPSVTAQVKEGQADSVVEWFEDEYAYGDLDAQAFVALVVDKLES
ncbi:hypothetical protein ENSA5_18390 [Enhygromyxa salina]|uniref:Uncharacterized protein n=1 Tax=Enhygromyxa salina TaxID=215803 RepID=A0A2S9YD69_9BACT|nr:hypothetical protein [Enhygromyxa salina]PRQ03068.1 hypothetical protein ENSA5_18390 [Enhygromyxa salina]